MLNLIERMNRQCACRLTLVGWFRSEKLKRRAMQHPGWSFVDYQGKVSHAETLAHTMRSDIGLAILDPVADYPTSSVTKLFEYMQFGIPCIASNFPAWKISTTIGPPGFYVEPLSPDLSGRDSFDGPWNLRAAAVAWAHRIWRLTLRRFGRPR